MQHVNLKTLIGLKILAIAGMFVSSFALAGSGITYHGRLLKPDGTPVDSSLVKFKIQIRSPGNEDCLMFQETHLRDMSVSDGIFAITINDGTASVVNTEPFSLDRVFQNRGTFTFAGGKCGLGTTYTSSATDGRRFAVSFDDGSTGGWEALPTQSISFVPMAMESLTVGGYGSGSMLRVNDGTGAPASIAALTQAQHTTFLDLIAGTSTLYLTSSSALGGANLANGSVTDAKLATGISGSKISGDITGNAAGFTGSLVGDVTGTQGATSVGKIRGRDIDTAVPTDGQILKWNQTNSRWQPSADAGITTETDPTVPANLKDGVDWTEVASKPTTFAPSAHTHVIDEITSASGKYFTYKPNDTACATGEILKWNNSRWECGTDASGGGGGGGGTITAVTATAPLASTGGATPDLSLAKADATHDGYLASADWSRFHDTLKGTAVDFTVAPTSGQFLKFGTTWTAATLAISDITSLSTQLGNKLDQSQMPAGCSASQTLSFISVTGSWACTNISASLTANVTGVLPVANGGTGTTNGSITGTGALALTAGAGNNNITLNPTGTGSTIIGGNIGAGTSSPVVKLDVAGEIRVGNASTACDSTIEGAIRYNSSSKKMEFCNASTWAQFSQGTLATVSISAPDASVSKSGPVNYTVTYGSGTDSNTISLASGNISFSGTSTTGCAATVTGSGLTRNVAVNSCSGTGTVGISVAANTAQSTSGDAAATAGPSTTFQADNTGPGAVTGIALGSVPNGLSQTPTITYTAASDTGGSSVASYQVQIKKASDNSVVKSWTTHTSGTALSSGFTLTASTDYYAEIRATDAVGNVGTVATSSNWTATAQWVRLANVESSGGNVSSSLNVSGYTKILVFAVAPGGSGGAAGNDDGGGGGGGGAVQLSGYEVTLSGDTSVNYAITNSSLTTTRTAGAGARTGALTITGAQSSTTYFNLEAGQNGTCNVSNSSTAAAGGLGGASGNYSAVGAVGGTGGTRNSSLAATAGVAGASGGGGGGTSTSGTSGAGGSSNISNGSPTTLNSVGGIPLDTAFTYQGVNGGAAVAIAGGGASGNNVLTAYGGLGSLSGSTAGGSAGGGFKINGSGGAYGGGGGGGGGWGNTSQFAGGAGGAGYLVIYAK